MRTATLPLTLALLATFAAGCGTTVGDPCTTRDDCGGDGLCINRSHTPGGYCSLQCVVSDPDSCPSGTECIPEGGGDDLAACYLECVNDDECRDGYVCRRVKDRPKAVCIGADGL